MANIGSMAQWRRRSARGPARAAFAMVTVPQRSSFYIFGGKKKVVDLSKREVLDVHMFNFEKGKWKTLTGAKDLEDVPHNRFGHTAVLQGDNVIVWGGINALGSSCVKVWKFDTASENWSRLSVSGSAPRPRYYHTACMIGASMWVHGGHSIPEDHLLSDMFALNFDSNRWTSHLIKNGVHARAAHTSTVIGDDLFVFGGRREAATPVMQVFNTEKLEWQIPEVIGEIPPDRSGHTAFLIEDELYIHGGRGSDGQDCDDEIYKYSPRDNEWRKIGSSGKRPDPRAFHQCCVYQQSIYVFGGDSKVGERKNWHKAVYVFQIGKENPEQDSSSLCESGSGAIARPLQTDTENRIPVAQSTPSFYREHCKQSYDVKGPVKGACMIINMTEIKERSTAKILGRPGARKDRDTMQDLFQSLEFDVTVYENPDEPQFINGSKNFVKEAVRAKAKSIFIVLMSHGGTKRKHPFIYTSEGNKLWVRKTIETVLSSSNAPALALVPKVIIVQACQGASEDKGVGVTSPQIQGDSTTMLSKDTVPEFAHFCIAYACQPDRPAYRVSGVGSWFIEEIDRVFREKAGTTDVVKMLTEVRRKVMEKSKAERDAYQIPETTDCLMKDFYIFPGIH